MTNFVVFVQTNVKQYFSKSANITKCKGGFKKAETLAIIPLWYGMVWYGMVWYGMAGQFLCV